MVTARSRSEPVDLGTIIHSQAAGGWNILRAPLGFILFLVSSFAETNRQPFDLPEAEPELVGPARLVGRLARRRRRLATLALFGFAGLVIFLLAERFAEALVASGAALGVDEFLLVQWLAPLASEAPEFIVAIVWTVRGQAAVALGALLSSKVNQWSLLIGTLPVAYSVGLGHPAALPLDGRQQDEVLLTAAQSLLGVAILVDLLVARWEMAVLFGLFVVQFIFPDIRLVASGAYILLGLVLLLRKRACLPPLVKEVFGRDRATASRPAS